MDYNLETLGDEGFQELCQALLSVSCPDLVCLPVNQPDGGRDALVISRQLTANPPRQSFTAFQVKFSRTPSIASEREAVLSLIRTEARKIQELKQRGLIKYFLLTNVRGTSHLDVGSIDKAHAELSSALGVPAYCYWRDDIERRLDANNDVKWSFPSILRGTDLLHGLISGNVSQDGHRRNSALKAYLSDQYGRDEEVKFKQVELQNRLLDLFTDVPVRLLGSGDNFDASEDYSYTSGDAESQRILSALAPSAHMPESLAICASSLFLQPVSAPVLSRVVLEGAPGQGKSTITQYVCQVHRMHFLAKTRELESLPEGHRTAQVRIPLRVDLRDYASWISGKSPFEPQTITLLPPGATSSLESFLAAQISEASGGFAFDVNDLSHVLKSSHVLIVLDGFDEVADIQVRKRLIDLIGQSAKRLHDQTLSLQVIVTSRPSAFANSPGFPKREWLHLDLQSLTLDQINRYATKWMSAKGLHERQRREFTSVIKDRLSQPHIRDLARNPMQLAILLSLINTKGVSLPDKRTALYDSYVDLFFSREAEKSEIVRDHRDLLMFLHWFLAWTLHTESENGKSNGSIEEGRLKEVISKFLDKEGHDTSLVGTLFEGMRLRVVAIVSRVQDMYEFEVQPLREYFCARYLYETAPYSPTGRERSGTKPDRFKAIACNSYWLNVTRFYAGCYSSGELSSLVDGIEELTEIPDLGNSSKPRGLAFTLLSDWVFLQQPHASRRVVNFILSEPGFRQYLATSTSSLSPRRLTISDSAGRKQLVEVATTLLSGGPKEDFAWALTRLIRANTTAEEAYAIWSKLQIEDDRRDDWLRMIVGFGIGHLIPVSQWKELASFGEASTIGQLLMAGRTDVLYSDPAICRRVFDSLLAGGQDARGFPLAAPSGWIETALSAFSLLHFYPIFSGDFPVHAKQSLRNVVDRFFPAALSQAVIKEPLPPGLAAIAEFAREIDSLLDDSLETWQTNLRPWTTLVEAGRRSLGNAIIWQQFAVIAAGVRLESKPGADRVDIFDDDIPLTVRARYGRLRAGSTSFWKTVLEGAANFADLHFALLLAVSWAGPIAFCQSLHLVASRIDKLEEEDWFRFARSARKVLGVRAHSPTYRKIDRAALHDSTHSGRILFLLSLRASSARQLSIYKSGLGQYVGSDKIILEEKAKLATSTAFDDPLEWNKTLEVVMSVYETIGQVYLADTAGLQQGRPVMPLEVARRVRIDAQRYPLSLLELADFALTEHAGKRARKVGVVAYKSNWFIDR